MESLSFIVDDEQLHGHAAGEYTITPERWSIPSSGPSLHNGSANHSAQIETPRTRNSCPRPVRITLVTCPLANARCRGLDNAGKTTIVKRLLGEDVHTVSPTLGFHIHALACNGSVLLLSVGLVLQPGLRYQLNLWDVGGQKSLRSYWKNYFESTDCLIWVVDSSDRERLADCKQEMHRLLQEERLMGAALLVFVNKQDLPHAMHPDHVARLLELESLKSHHWTVMGCSAYSGDNLLQGIEWLISDVSSRLFSFE